jgi:hypothetical protein
MTLRFPSPFCPDHWCGWEEEVSLGYTPTVTTATVPPFRSQHRPAQNSLTSRQTDNQANSQPDSPIDGPRIVISLAIVSSRTAIGICPSAALGYTRELKRFAYRARPQLSRCPGIRPALAPDLDPAMDTFCMPRNLALPVMDLADPSKAGAPPFSPLFI